MALTFLAEDGQGSGVITKLSSPVFLGTFLAATSLSYGASSGPRFYGDAPDEHHAWAVHDGNRPQPVRVVPGTFSSQERAGRPPADAVILFDGKDLSGWTNDKGGAAGWAVRDGYMEVVPGTGEIRTREQFGDCQLHIEYAAPSKVEGDGQGRGNSGIFLMGRLEIQVLDSYDNVTYADGHAGAYYGVNPPLALPLNPPGKFQVYDIVFRRPVYRGSEVVDPGYVTVFMNGVLVQDHTALEGAGGHMGRSRPGPFPEKGYLSLQDHGNPTRFRNVWYRPLPPRTTEGGTDGWLSTEAAMAKRQETAAALREQARGAANSADPVPEMLALMESLVYAPDEKAMARSVELAEGYVASVTRLSGAELQGKKDQVKQLNDIFKYLLKWKVVAAPFGPQVALDKMIEEQGWNKRNGR